MNWRKSNIISNLVISIVVFIFQILLFTMKIKEGNEIGAVACIMIALCFIFITIGWSIALTKKKNGKTDITLNRTINTIYTLYFCVLIIMTVVSVIKGIIGIVANDNIFFITMNFIFVVLCFAFIILLAVCIKEKKTKKRYTITLPVMPGDIVYFLKEDYHDSAEVTRIEISKNRIDVFWVQYEQSPDVTEIWDVGSFSIDEIGKTVFLTAEERDKARTLS